MTDIYNISQSDIALYDKYSLFITSVIFLQPIVLLRK